MSWSWLSGTRRRTAGCNWRDSIHTRVTSTIGGTARSGSTISPVCQTRSTQYTLSP
jgi:hypothetical protein